MSLKNYEKKRRLDQTPEPGLDDDKRVGNYLRFVIHKHDATRLHYDLRLEVEGRFISWAVPKGPSLNPTDQRLAVLVEDHPLSYGNFEGVIPKGNYGAGAVMIWDAGQYHARASENIAETERIMYAGLKSGSIAFVLHGQKVRGEFALIRLGDDAKNWLLIKKRDDFASVHDILKEDFSVASQRSLSEIETGLERPVLDGDEIYLLAPRVAPKKNSSLLAASPQEAQLEDLMSAPKERLPVGIKAMQAQRLRVWPDAQGWLCHQDVEGTRVIVSINKSKVEFHSRLGLKLRRDYPEIKKAAALLEVDSAVLDVVVTRGDDTSENVGMVLDLLYLDGRNLRTLNTLTRWQTLSNLVFDSTCLQPIELCAEEAARTANTHTWILRDPSASYRSGVQKEWVQIDGAESTSSMPRTTNLEKLYWKEEKISKGDLINYYTDVADYLLPHLRDHPLSLNRHPNGIDAPGFFQKNMTGYLPSFLETVSVASRHGRKSINFTLCHNKESLIYLANLGCIELNPWLSRQDNLDYPIYSVLDLDPHGQSFFQVKQVALAAKEELEKLGYTAYGKTSGGGGIHVFVKLQPNSTYEDSREIMFRAASELLPRFDFVSLDRSTEKRRGKLYLDTMQNRRGQTLASIYCVRPRPGAPVSFPFRWHDLDSISDPKDINIRNALDILKKDGDLWSDVLIPAC